MRISTSLKLLLLSWIFLHSNEYEVDLLFRDLGLVKQIDEEINDHLPFIYNSSLNGGYLNMPSARMNTVGMGALGAIRLPPYNIYSVNFQAFERIELTFNYRVYTGIMEWHLGPQGFGDDADRGVSARVALLSPSDGYRWLPNITFGADDFYGTSRFASTYLVATKEWNWVNLETSLGWGKKRISGWFGGVAWSPFRNYRKGWWKVLKGLTLIGEYDATDYKRHTYEHEKGREVASPINAGASLTILDALQLKVASQRGKEVAYSASLNYNFGETKGLFPKVENPAPYSAPLDTEALGHFRPEKEFAQQLAYAFEHQGLTLYSTYLTSNREGKKSLWLKCLNIRYRTRADLRNRIQKLLAALVPSNIESTTVVIEANGIPVYEYVYCTKDLRRYLDNQIGDPELEILSPLQNPTKRPPKDDSLLLYRKKKEAWTFMVGPRLMTFFGSASGKFKYSLGALAGVSGYLGDEFFYDVQGSYNIKASFWEIKPRDFYNPSRQLIVRTDSILYYQSNSWELEKAYLQKGMYLGKNWYGRLAAGYFEPAYGGLAGELLYYPVGKDWAFGFEIAGVPKRTYHGIGFVSHTLRLEGNTYVKVPFIGFQYFLDIYYDFKPLNLDFKINIGQFLARDKGARFEVARYYPSGLRVAFWYTITNAKDYVNGKRYQDRGVSFQFPLDIFMKKSTRTMMGYAMSFWLRDVGARAMTGRRLYDTILTERLQY